ncbi:MAG: UDP-N-acetylglucosamine--N-acetylmuramyl-(pentapeptide) pyrophosphoryl-undecaprenol N-acetylglucosamine transferase [Oscillospiraceae bacterium]
MSIKVKGFHRSFAPADIIDNFKAVYLALRSKSAAKKIVTDFKPDIVVGTGGYVSGPVVLAATKLGIKTAIHEQNAFPGVTTKILSKKVDIVMLAVDEAKKSLDSSCNFITVGNPIKEGIIYKTKTEARKELGIDDKLCILCFGGSLGADTINKIGADIAKWTKNGEKATIIHGYGRLGKEKFPQLLLEKSIDVANSPWLDAREYIDNMDVCLAAADLVVCRAGAITLSEIEATGTPSLLIPSPNVTENHQYHNAMVLVNKNAAMILEEKNYNTQAVNNILNDIFDNPQKLKSLSVNASKLAVLDTAERIYSQIVCLIS